MIQIVINIKLFSFKQTVQVFQDKECIELIEVPVNDINKTIEDLYYKYPIERINFIKDNYLVRMCRENLKKYLKEKNIIIEIF